MKWKKNPNKTCSNLAKSPHDRLFARFISYENPDKVLTKFQYELSMIGEINTKETR
jgi:hypothetical protein